MVVGAIALVLIGLIGTGAWLGSQVLTVRGELLAARGVVDGLPDSDMKQALLTLADHGERAVVAAHDPVWGAAESLPWVGDNLEAARLAAETLDALAGGLGVPALAALQDKSNEPMLSRLLPVLQEAAPIVHELNSELQVVRGSNELVAQLRDPINQVAEVTAAVDPVLRVVPELLGAEGERNYLLVAQSNAETLALGGSAASQSLVRFADGGMKIVKQADSQQYQWGVHADVDIDQSALDLYNEYLINNVNTAVGRPDWPTAAKTIIALWNRDIDPEPVDGAISIDPLALARIMRATGPVTVDGRELNSENVVSFLLSEAYALYDPSGGGDADEIFKEVALAVMDSLVTGDFEPSEMWRAINESINTGSLMFWSANPEIQEMITPWRLSGILPSTNLPTTTIGVFFRDASLGSKIDYYLRTEAEVTSACEADGSVRYIAAVTLWLDLTKKQAKNLPRYVTGGELATKDFRTQVFFYGPPGTKAVDAKTDGRTWRWRPLGMTDLGRPTPSFMTHQPLGGKKVTVQVSFVGAPGEYGPLEVRTTPMVHPTVVTASETCGR